MYRGTTPTITVNFKNLYTYEFDVIKLYVYQNDKPVAIFSMNELELLTKGVKATLTQEQTLAISEDSNVKIQIRGKMKNGTVVATRVFSVGVNDVLNDEAL